MGRSFILHHLFPVIQHGNRGTQIAPDTCHKVIIRHPTRCPAVSVCRVATSVSSQAIFPSSPRLKHAQHNPAVCDPDSRIHCRYRVAEHRIRKLRHAPACARIIRALLCTLLPSTYTHCTNPLLPFLPSLPCPYRVRGCDEQGLLALPTLQDCRCTSTTTRATTGLPCHSTHRYPREAKASTE